MQFSINHLYIQFIFSKDMAEIIRMPKMSDTMLEGVIAKWVKKVGDKVKSGDVLAEVETDKATMELESYHDGILLYIGVEEKNAVAIDGLIAIIGKAGEDISSILASSNTGTQVAQTTTVATPETQAPAVPKQEISNNAPNIKANVVRMPKMSDTMLEGVIAKWVKKVGDKVKSGDVLAEVETDKATMELESYDTGTLLYIGAEAGKAVAIDAIIAIIGEANADYQQLLNYDKQKSTNSQITQSSVNEVVTTSTNTVVNNTPASSPTTNANNTNHSNTAAGENLRVKASPLAKSIAKEKGLDITKLAGSGENGRIIKRDIETYKPAQENTKSLQSSTQQATNAGNLLAKESFSEVPVSQMRKVIARRLGESMFTAPHFYLTMEINMDKAMTARTSINEVAPVKVSFNDMIIKACAVALKKHPNVNSSWLGDKIRYNDHVHIGVAVAVEDGLLVPVVRFADSKSLSQISAEVKDLGAKAKTKKLQPADWEGNTFSISNLGMFGIEEFTAIINPPDACILAVGAISETPIVKNGQIVVGNVMKVTLSCDHRVVDGATGAAFLQTLKSFLEDPIRLLA
jgi:pyruvate dehydrogenase E2 component (dihydrolipoamide acetyltransferase)